MSAFFLEILNMSISASYLLIAVMLLRFPLKKAPKWISVLLFGIAAVRLVCPFSVESVLSLLPSANTVSPDILMDNSPTINSGIPIIDSAVNPIITDTFKPSYGDSVNPLQVVTYCASIAWIVGMAVLAIHATISYLKIKRKVSEAILVRDNIYKCDSIASPFVLGVIKPRIYLPFGTEECGEEYIISHEMAHIRRKDHLWKPLGYLILTVHWFNPLVWLGYILLCRDIEGACDEKVIKDLNRDERADYSEALLICSLNRRLITACPLAFGEQGVKGRIRFVLNYKKPAFWIIIAALVLAAAISVFFLTNPITHKESLYLTEENMLYGGEGYFTEYEFRNTVNRYTGTCESLEWSSADGAYIKTDFKAVSAEVRVFSPGALEDYGTTTPTHYMIAPIIKGEHDVYVDIGWYYRATSSDQTVNFWSYLVIVTDADGVVHNYYFRVKYDTSARFNMPMLVDSVEFDIDGDGADEICEIINDVTLKGSPVFFSVKEKGAAESTYYQKINNGFTFSTFAADGDTLYVDSVNTLSSSAIAPVIRYEVTLENGSIVLTRIGELTE